MSTATVRISSKCQNACLFCDDAAMLDGTVRELAEVTGDIDRAVAGGATEVVFSGGESTLSRHLLAAIKHAKAAGVRVALTTNGRIIGSMKVAQMLEAAGVDEVRVSVHSGRRTTHDALTGSQNAWVESLAGLRFAGRTKMDVVIHSVLTKHNHTELAHLMHLGCMAGVKGMRIYQLKPRVRVKDRAAFEPMYFPMQHAVRLMGELWYDAKEEGVLLSQVGFGHTQDLGFDAEEQTRQADRAALQMLRERVLLHQAAKGLTMLDQFDMGKDFVGLTQKEGGLRQVGHELKARYAPLLDGPWCIGGRPQVELDHWGDKIYYGEACADCSLRPRCAGLPKKLAKLDKGELRPQPTWRPLEGPGVVLRSGDDLLAGFTLPELAEALAEGGLEARLVEEATDASEAEWVVCAGAQAAAAVRAAAPQARCIVLDTALGAGLAELDVEVVSYVPGRVETLLEAGVQLDHVTWRAYPAPRSTRRVEVVPMRSDRIVALGETTDLGVLEAAIVHCTGKLPPVHLYTSEDRAPTETGGLRVHTGADDATLLEAICTARFVVFPFTRGKDTAARRAALARDLRWVSIATAAGRPVVAIRAPGVEDQVRHDKTGWLVAAGDMRHLSEALRRVNGEVRRITRYHHGAMEFGASYVVDAWAAQLLAGVQPQSETLVETGPRPWPVF